MSALPMEVSTRDPWTPAGISRLSAVQRPTLRPETHGRVTARYRGFSIRSRPYRLNGSGQWTVDLEIRRKGHSTCFSLDDRYLTEGEANDRCIALGQQIIDGAVPGWSVDHLRGPRPWFMRLGFTGRLALIGVVAFLLLAVRGEGHPGLARQATSFASDLATTAVTATVSAIQDLYYTIKTGP